MRKATRKVYWRILWMARGTATLMGFAVMLALVFGAGTTALAAVPGDPFKLGKLNAVGAASTLVGSVNGALLNVQNNSPGSRATPAPAVSLKVAAGNPPLVANPEAGTATGLSADELDGKDSTSFAEGTGGKANDANRLDGLDSTQIGINGYKFVRAETAFDSNPFKRTLAECPAGTKIVGGGGDVIISAFDPNGNLAPIALRTNGVDINGLNHYDVAAVEVAPYGFEWQAFAMAICAKVGNP